MELKAFGADFSDLHEKRQLIVQCGGFYVIAAHMGQDKPERIVAADIAKQSPSALFKIGKVDRIVDVTEGVKVTESNIDIYLNSLCIIQFSWCPVVCSLFLPDKFVRVSIKLDLIYESMAICQDPG